MSGSPQYKRAKIDSNNLNMTEAEGVSKLSLDEKALNKFSRQNAALGADTTAKLTKMRVIVFGLRGIGAEVSKNLALQGVGAITLVDDNLIAAKDIGQNFFFLEEDVGKPRTTVMQPRLKELNEFCHVSVATELNEALIESHTALVITSWLDYNRLMYLNEFCRNHRVSFFLALSGGVASTIFVDHGDHHVVTDFDGERPIQKLITEIVKLSDTDCLIRYDTPEGQLPSVITRGSYEINEVAGIMGMNGMTYDVSHPEKDPVKSIRVTFDWKMTDEYEGGGILTEKKMPTPYPMESLIKKMKSPGNPFTEPPTLVLTDLLNFGSEQQLHIAFYAVLSFYSQKKRLPYSNNEEETAEVVKLAKDLIANQSIDLEVEVDETIIKNYSSYIELELQPMAAFIGGVLAQEVVKCSGKFTPIPGFMHFASFESLPDADKRPSGVEISAKNSRYDELAAVFGWSMVERLQQLRYFMVGCGALGCEFMKNFALNGICCGPQGKLVVTDADRIELSNLSRQFLFREHNVGQPKSRAAGIMAKVMNPAMQIESLEVLVSPQSEDTFSDQFWNSLDGVCNAVDNMEARFYVDSQCVRYEKPLLESGTMGTKGNVESICPFKTRTYAEGGKAMEGGGIPMCTLRNFPHLTDHCIEWARDIFELLFVKLAKQFESYVQDPSGFEHKIRDKASSETGAALIDIRSVISFAKLAANPSIGGAAQLAFDVFHYLFRDRILDLQAAFPKDARMIDPDTKQDKGPFWGEKKRYPAVAVFNPHDPVHTDFLLSCTCLFGVIIGLLPAKQENDDHWLEQFRDPQWMINIASGLTVPTYIQAPVVSEGIEASASVDKSAIQGIISGLINELTNVTGHVASHSFRFDSMDFEKDDDKNFHINFVTSAANLRCDNYSIRRTDFQSCKVIAGKIIAAIATTTAAVCGLVILELFKLLQQKGTDAYMNRAIGLEGFTYTSFTADEPKKFKTTVDMIEPDACQTLPDDAYDINGKVKSEYMVKIVKRAYPESHSVWDKLVFSADLTLKEFMTTLDEKHGLKLKAWDFVYGYKHVTDEETKSKSLAGVTATVYPIKPVLNYSLLPPLDLTLAQATQQIMRTAAAKPTQQYLALWKELKAQGSIPFPPPVESSEVITESTTLREILHRMNHLAVEGKQKKVIELPAISNIDQRLFHYLPANETPSCVDKETGDVIEYLCSMKIIL